MPGTLYVVATPIGNLEDITLRAVRTLRECALVACEDTRQTRKLLDHLNLSTPLISLHEHNEAERCAPLLERLDAGDSLALVSDAGTPLISDPGFRLVQATLAAGFPVVPIPGPSVVTAALSAAGLPTDSFRFGGFLPAKETARRKELESLALDGATLVFFESPHRILESLETIAAVMPDRPVVLAREVSKIHEEFLRGTASDLSRQLRQRASILGEFTVLVGKRPRKSTREVEREDAIRLVTQLEAEGLTRKEAMKRAARELGVGKSGVYRYFTDDGTGDDG